MSDPLLLVDRIKNAILIGESDYREFKSALEGRPESKKPRLLKRICEDIGEALVAFANADGGELLIGVEDDGSITGVPHSEAEIMQMLAAPQTHVHQDSKLPMSFAGKVDIDTKRVLFFSVAKGSTEIYQLPDGRCVRRKNKQTVPETVKRIQFERQEVRSREYDRQFVDGASVNDLDIVFIQSLADRYLRGLTVEKYLQQLGLAEYTVSGLRLRMATLLLFAKDIQRWHPRSQVRIVKVNGTELKFGDYYNVRADDTVPGNIFELLDRSWQRLLPYLADKTEFGTDAKFEQRYIYPERACQEALVNAIAHRDYSIQNGIEIFIFDDRMEIKSPGALLSTLTVKDLEKLEGAHESRNVLIARVLRENKFMRELGEGIRRIFELMEKSEREKPKLYSNTLWFSVTLSHKSVFSAQQQLWLSYFDSQQLTPYQRKIVASGMDGREISPKDIYRAMNTDDRNIYDREVTGLRNARILIPIRNQNEVKLYAQERKISKQEVPKFRVEIPQPDEQKDSQSDLIQSTAMEPSNTLYIGNLPSFITKKEIENLVKVYGVIERIDLPINYETGKPKGFAILRFLAPDSVDRAIYGLYGTVINDRLLKVGRYQPQNYNRSP